MLLSLIVSLMTIGYYSYLLVSVRDIRGNATIKGTFYNASGGRVEGVTVSVEGTDVSDVTDEVGNYELKGAPGGEQVLIFERGGYPVLRVTQLLLPEKYLDRFGEKSNRLDVPDNLVGGPLLETPSFRFDLEDNIPERSNLSGRILDNGVPMAHSRLTVYNSTVNTSVDGNGSFYLRGVFPGMFMFNVTTLEDEKLHGLAILKEGDYDISFHRKNDTSFFNTLYEKESGFVKERNAVVTDVKITDAAGKGMKDAEILCLPKSLNPMNETLVGNISAPWSGLLNITKSGNGTATLIEGALYDLEIRVPGYPVELRRNLTYNGTAVIGVRLGDALRPEKYSYSLAGFYAVVIYQIIMVVLIGYGLKSAIFSPDFTRIMIGTIAAIASSASVPLALLSLDVAHNWIFGGAALVLLYFGRKGLRKK